MQNLQTLSAFKAQIKGVCFDIDDTFSSNGKITAEAYQSLWNLRNAGFALIPVTGRPAGWCDLIARFWPVDGVVGENGAFSFYMNEGRRERIDTLGEEDRNLAKMKLRELREALILAYPHAEFASDQDYREYDLAIDFCEDVVPWSAAQVSELVHFCQAQGAIAKVSSIHVNTWFGQYTKIEGIRHFLETTALNLRLPKFEEFVYVGDSPNDEPMFEAFNLSVGVANVKPFFDQLKHRPKWITPSEAGAGFSELAALLLSPQTHA